MAVIKEIADISSPELAVYTHLTEAQLRCRRHPEEGLFIAESGKVIAHALDAGLVPVSMLMERRHIKTDAVQLLARCGEIPVYTGDETLLSQLTGYRLTRGILCAMRRPMMPAVEDICRNARRVAVLEGVVDATNIGAVFRSAAALHMDAVLLTPTCCDPLHRRAVRVSMGTVFQVPWAYLGENWTDGLRKLGFRTAAMALDDRAISIEDKTLASQERLAIVLGTEGDGLRPETVAACDYTVKIPMSHGVDSLNVAAASAVAFWELRIK